jgi:hypothetical protein
MKRTVAAALIAVLALTGILWVRARSGPKLHVDYYYIPYCLSCAKVKNALATFHREFGPRVAVRTIDCFSKEGVAAASKYGFVTHGIVVEDRDRELLFQEKDHGVSAEDVRVVVREELTRR